MSKSINEIIKENIIKELDACNIPAGNLTKMLIEAREEFDSILDSILEELKKEEEEFKPEYGDAYWAVDSNGRVGDIIWTDHVYDEIALENNAIFKTQEEAEFEAERLKVLRALEKMGRAFKPHTPNYIICLECINNQKEYLSTKFVKSQSLVYGDYYFDSEEEAEKAIEKIGAKRIKKYLFGIEE